MTPLIITLFAIMLAFWLAGWLIVFSGMAWVKLADKFHKLTKGKWQ